MKLIESKIASISSQIDNVYFDKINHIISQDDYFRYTNESKYGLENSSKNKRDISNPDSANVG